MDAERLFRDAVAHQAAGRFAEAAADYGRIVEGGLQTLNLLDNYSQCLMALGELDAARTWLARAIDHRPDRLDLLQRRYALGMAYLAEGRFAEGWPLLEGREASFPDLAPVPRVQYPEWRGEPLDGRSILVSVEQGFGDQIMFARFAADLKARGARWVTLACRPALASLLERLAGVDQVIPLAPRQAFIDRGHDAWTRYFSLPLHLGVTLETLSGAPYIDAPAEGPRGNMGRQRLGVAWRTSATGANAREKSIPDAAIAPILARGAVSLHPEDTGAQDFRDTARIIAGLDAVISADTAVAHLAGAMGKPTVVLLPQPADWRWLKAREDSPWYGSVRLVRRAPGEPWAAVVARAAEVLDRL